jgi:hypothetical protein
LEITIMDERFVGSPASFLAAGAHCLARLMLRKGNWVRSLTLSLVHVTDSLVSRPRALCWIHLFSAVPPHLTHARVLRDATQTSCGYL